MAVLIALRSVSPTVAPRVNGRFYCRFSPIIAKSLKKTPSRSRLGVFASVLFLSCFLSFPAFSAQPCTANGDIEWAQIKKIVDGDTLHLRDGRKVRVMGINTPEIGYRKKDNPSYPQPLAIEARQAVVDFFSAEAKVGLGFGVQRVDHYGRVLADVYRADGANLSAHVLALGLAWHVVVPPNESGWPCLAAVEAAAKQQKTGVWSDQYYPVKQAKNLSINDTGFQRVTGRVISVNRSRGGWWLQLGQLAIRVQEKNLKYLDDVNPQGWLNQSLTIRGWIVDRSESVAVKKKGYSPLMMNLQHSAMLK